MKLDTIVALATPPMKSALAIIRVSGEDCFDIVSEVFSKDIRNTDKKTIYVGNIIDQDKVIDEVVLLAYKGPKSFTGENLVEIIIHGSMLIANEVIKLLLSKGARMASNGEYSSRAFLNNKIDLIQAEAINDVINATSKEAKDLSILSLKGNTSELILPIKKRLADLISLIEVNIDYPEYEDIEVANKDTIIKYVDELSPKLDELTKSGEQGLLIKEGIKVAIVGKPNVGKSSLLNALIGEDKAIVTDIAGTTRDVVEGEVNLKGITLHILDTAGIRNADNKVETIGVDKSIDAIKKADLVLVILDASSEIDKEDNKILELTKDSQRIIVYNKSDKSKSINKDLINISALNGDVESLKDAIYKKLGISEKSFVTPSFNNVRQLGLLRRSSESLKKAKEDALNDLSIDLIAVSLMDAYNAVLEILGENNQLDLSKEIFSRFCVGK
ncbi:MAG: tRNA uridine-5-carboxymethylaminomethyl(34) synthesis GTPase MnmE [Bacilli bacterium]|nr:tRNA uridine-5-carboxymethylaminomethyl(34) synthesis GTPase MnmE [Bacilli bacterium]